MKEGFIVFWAIIAIVVIILGFSFGGLAYRKYFEPKHKEIDREVWEETPSRIHGATQEIAKRQLEYIRAESESEKKAICATLRNMYSNLNPEVIDDYELRQFFKKCKSGG